MSIDAQNSALRVLGAHYDDLAARPGVVAIGVGVRQRGGKVVMDEICIVVEVAKKLSPSALDAARTLPTVLDGIGVDVIELRETVPQVLKMRASELEDTAMYRPLVGGAMISNLLPDANGLIEAGTLGANVYVTPGGATPDPRFVGILSCNHVLYANGAQKGALIWQPIVVDGQVASNWGGRKDSGEPSLDVALAGTAAGVGFINQVLQIGRLTGINVPTVGQRVRKYGYRTQYTVGYVYVLEVTGPSYNLSIVGLRIFQGWPIPDATKMFSNHGDSGSVVVNDNNEVVGLLWAGTDQYPYYSRANAMSYISATWQNITIPVPVSSQLVGLLVDSDRLAVFRASMEKTDRGRTLAQGIVANFEECKRLNHSQKECMAAWRALHGSAFIPVRETGASDGPHFLQREIDGVTLSEMLSTMSELYIRHGSPQLVEFAATYGEAIVRHAAASNTIEELVEALSAS